MASIDDLKAVIRETLETRGVLGQLQSRIRAEIFNALEDRPVDKPKLSNDNLIINELIREYLEYNGYSNTLSVFLPETGQPNPPTFETQFLESHLHLRPALRDRDSLPHPLLYRAIRKLHDPTPPVSDPYAKPTPSTWSQAPAASDHQRKLSSASVDASLDPATGDPKPLSFIHY